jgi:hypothetical protein
MKMKNLILSAIGIVCLNGTTSWAHTRHCLIDAWDVLHTESVILPGCELSLPLAVIQTEACYPKMDDNPWPVKIWQGQYVRQVQVNKTVQHTLYDQCQGVVVSRDQEEKTEISYVDFNVENPNLDPSLDATYELSPMTDSEAQTALGVAHTQCLGFAVF